MDKSILVTGGAGFIGSNTAKELLERGFNVVAIDNLSNSGIDRIDLLKKYYPKKFVFEVVDIRDKVLMSHFFKQYDISVVIHFAALKSVFDSQSNPLHYFDNNISGTISLLAAMSENGCNKLIFSSSCTVYGDVGDSPATEVMERSIPSSPYGRTKQMCEDLINDWSNSDPRISAVSLRYFNPVGSDDTNVLGDNFLPTTPTLFSQICMCIGGEQDYLRVFGGDYPTQDGTAIRDYIHVSDLAKGHVAAMDWVLCETGHRVYNLGTGIGYSVRSVIEEFEKIVGYEVGYKIEQRRNGDVPISYADASRALHELNWSCEFGLSEMVSSAWQSYCLKRQVMK